MRRVIRHLQRRGNRGQHLGEYAVLFGIVISAAVATQMHVSEAVLNGIWTIGADMRYEERMFDGDNYDQFLGEKVKVTPDEQKAIDALEAALGFDPAGWSKSNSENSTLADGDANLITTVLDGHSWGESEAGYLLAESYGPWIGQTITFSDPLSGQRVSMALVDFGDDASGFSVGEDLKKLSEETIQILLTQALGVDRDQLTRWQSDPDAWLQMLAANTDVTFEQLTDSDPERAEQFQTEAIDELLRDVLPEGFTVETLRSLAFWDVFKLLGSIRENEEAYDTLVAFIEPKAEVLGRASKGGPVEMLWGMASAFIKKMDAADLAGRGQSLDQLFSVAIKESAESFSTDELDNLKAARAELKEIFSEHGVEIDTDKLIALSLGMSASQLRGARKDEQGYRELIAGKTNYTPEELEDAKVLQEAETLLRDEALWNRDSDSIESLQEALQKAMANEDGVIGQAMQAIGLGAGGPLKFTAGGRVVWITDDGGHEHVADVTIVEESEFDVPLEIEVGKDDKGNLMSLFLDWQLVSDVTGEQIVQQGRDQKKNAQDLIEQEVTSSDESRFYSRDVRVAVANLLARRRQEFQHLDGPEFTEAIEYQIELLKDAESKEGNNGHHARLRVINDMQNAPAADMGGALTGPNMSWAAKERARNGFYPEKDSMQAMPTDMGFLVTEEGDEYMVGLIGEVRREFEEMLAAMKPGDPDEDPDNSLYNAYAGLSIVGYGRGEDSSIFSGVPVVGGLLNFVAGGFLDTITGGEIIQIRPDAMGVKEIVFKDSEGNPLFITDEKGKSKLADEFLYGVGGTKDDLREGGFPHARLVTKTVKGKFDGKEIDQEVVIGIDVSGDQRLTWREDIVFVSGNGAPMAQLIAHPDSEGNVDPKDFESVKIDVMLVGDGEPLKLVYDAEKKRFVEEQPAAPLHFTTEENVGKGLAPEAFVVEGVEVDFGSGPEPTTIFVPNVDGDTQLAFHDFAQMQGLVEVIREGDDRIPAPEEQTHIGYSADGVERWAGINERSDHRVGMLSDFEGGTLLNVDQVNELPDAKQKQGSDVSFMQVGWIVVYDQKELDHRAAMNRAEDDPEGIPATYRPLAPISPGQWNEATSLPTVSVANMDGDELTFEEARATGRHPRHFEGISVWQSFNDDAVPEIASELFSPSGGFNPIQSLLSNLEHRAPTLQPGSQTGNTPFTEQDF